MWNIFWISTEWTEIMIVHHLEFVLCYALAKFLWVEYLAFWATKSALEWINTTTDILIEFKTSGAIILTFSMWNILWIATEWSKTMIINQTNLFIIDAFAGFKWI